MNQTDPLDDLLFDLFLDIQPKQTKSQPLADKYAKEAKAAINAEIAKAVRDELQAIMDKGHQDFKSQVTMTTQSQTTTKALYERLAQLKEEKLMNNQDVTAGNSGQMLWSQLVDKIVANRLRLERKEIEVTEYHQNYQDLIAELAHEIMSRPYSRRLSDD